MTEIDLKEIYSKVRPPMKQYQEELLREALMRSENLSSEEKIIMWCVGLQFTTRDKYMLSDYVSLTLAELFHKDRLQSLFKKGYLIKKSSKKKNVYDEKINYYRITYRIFAEAQGLM